MAHFGMRMIPLAGTADRRVFRFLRDALLERAGYEPAPRSRARACGLNGSVFLAVHLSPNLGRRNDHRSL